MSSYRNLRWTQALFATVLVVTTACGVDSDDVDDAGPDGAPPSPACAEATTYQDLASIEAKTFKSSCTLSGCHNGAPTNAGRLDLREGMAHASLVNVTSRLDPTRKLVVPGQANQSLLLLMLGQIAPDEMSPPAAAVPSPGLMPLNGGDQLMCVEKREAIARWIAAGAPNY